MFSTRILPVALGLLASRAELSLRLFDLAKHPLAICNDGSPSGLYYQSPSSQQSSDTWIIHQQGGDWCYDEASCRARAATGSPLVTSLHWEATRDASGILNSTAPGLAGAHVVYAPYCTSDGWIGSAPSPLVGFNFTFHMLGSHVVDALVETLVTDFGLGATPGTRVLYSGCSAGARGVAFNLPRMPALLSRISPTPLGAFGALLDSMFWIDVAPLNPSTVPFAREVQGVYALANTTGQLNPACTAAHPGSAGWVCMMGQYALPYLASTRLPYFFHTFQYDAFQLAHDLGLPFGAPPVTPQSVAYADAFRNATRGAAAVDLLNAPPPHTAGMLPACLKHCNTESSTWGSMETLGVTLEAAVAAWFNSLGGGVGGGAPREEEGGPPPSIPRFIQDDCYGVNCGVGCPAV